MPRTPSQKSIDVCRSAPTIVMWCTPCVWSFRMESRPREPTLDRCTSMVHVGRVVMEHEPGVSHEDGGVQVEDELRRILVRRQLALRLGGRDELRETLTPRILDLGDPILHRTGMRVELRGDRGEEAAAGKHAPLDV